MTLLPRTFKYIVEMLMYAPAELGYVLICQVKENKKCIFENPLVKKRESSTRNE